MALTIFLIAAFAVVFVLPLIAVVFVLPLIVEAIDDRPGDREATVFYNSAEGRAQHNARLRRAGLLERKTHMRNLETSYYSPRNPRPADSPVYFESERHAAAAGFRFVGYSDELVHTRDRHTGWYADEFCGSTYRGAVFQLATGRHGAMRFVGGYQESDNGGFVVDVRGRGVVYSETVADPWDRQNYRSCSTLRSFDSVAEAAGAADESARIAAERERDYQTAWQAGARWRELGEQITETRREILSALAERRQVEASEVPTLCDMLRRTIGDMLDSIAAARREREELTEIARWKPDAWCDGADLTAAEFARI